MLFSGTIFDPSIIHLKKTTSNNSTID